MADTARIEDLLSRVTELSDEELDEMVDLVRQALDGLLAPDPDVVVSSAQYEEIAQLAGAMELIENEHSKRKSNTTNLEKVRSGLNRLIPADRLPQHLRARNSARAVTASGSPISDRAALAVELTAAIAATTSEPRNGSVNRVAHISRTDRPVLPSSDAVAAARIVTEHAGALVAAGGLGGPVEQVDYTLPGVETIRRPIQSALPRFSTERGGIRFMVSPQLADVDGALTTWDLADDIAAVADEGPRKNVIRVEPTLETVVNTEAVATRLQVGNLMERAYPELVTRYLDLLDVAHARRCEQRLLASMAALSTPVTATGTLGVTRVLLTTLERAAVQIRDRHRAEPNAPVTVVLPAFVEAMLRSDLAMQMPGDATLGVTSAELATYFAQRGVSVVYTLDSGNFGAQSANTALLEFPASITAHIFLTGTFFVMEGGTLDIGVVRSPDLNARNDFEIMSEEFLALVRRLPGALSVTMPAAVSGDSSAAV